MDLGAMGFCFICSARCIPPLSQTAYSRSSARESDAFRHRRPDLCSEQRAGPLSLKTPKYWRRILMPAYLEPGRRRFLRMAETGILEHMAAACARLQEVATAHSWDTLHGGACPVPTGLIFSYHRKNRNIGLPFRCAFRVPNSDGQDNNMGRSRSRLIPTTRNLRGVVLHGRVALDS
jgi:hypothetical protein